MLLIALYVAGLFLVLREAVPWSRARTTGVVRTRGHRREAVSRSSDPERFAALMGHRFRAMGPGALILLIALAWTALIVVNLLLGSI